MVWGSCSRRRGFKNWTNKARVFVCGVRRGRRFHLQAPCVMCSCGRHRIKASSVFPTLCVGGEASPTQNSLPHTSSQPPQRQHTSSSDCTPAAKLQISSILASKREEKNLFAHVLLILTHDRKRADACQSCGGGALPFHTQLGSCLASVLRQYLSFSVWQKQSHWFLILIPFFSYWSPIHP